MNYYPTCPHCGDENSQLGEEQDMQLNERTGRMVRVITYICHECWSDYTIEKTYAVTLESVKTLSPKPTTEGED